MKRIVTIATIICAVILVSALMLRSAPKPIDGAHILMNMLESESKTSFTGVQITSVDDGAPKLSRQRVTRDRLNSLRIEWLAPAEMKGEVMIDNGRQIMRYVPGAKAIHVRPSHVAVRRNHAGEIAERLKNGTLRVTVIGQEKVAGRKTYVIEVTSTQGRGPTRRFWVDTEKWVRLKSVETNAAGKVQSSSSFIQVKFMDSIPASNFAMPVPAGVTVTRSPMMDARHFKTVPEAQPEVNFKVVTPTYIPSGFKQAGVTVSHFRGLKLVSIRFTDNISSYSIFETPLEAVHGPFMRGLRDGQAQNPGQGMYFWKVGTLNVSVLGHLEPSEVKRIVDSMH
jgi:outer membrane lipoprotein-sorting protein